MDPDVKYEDEEGKSSGEENVKTAEAAPCPFCRIVRGELPARLLYEDGEVLGFEDAHPQAPVHALIIPRRHIESLDHLTAADRGLAGHLILVAVEVARRLGVAERGYRLVVNVRGEAGQTVHHLHLHILGGRALRWPPG